MMLTVCVIIDPIEQLNESTDTSIALIAAAERQGHQCFITQSADIFYTNSEVRARCQSIRLDPRGLQYCQLGDDRILPLTDFDVILLRKDPPFDEDYLNLTQLLDWAVQQGVTVANHPQALRQYNEKLAITHFPELCAPTIVDTCPKRIHAFIAQVGHAVLKPLNGMGGQSIFTVRHLEANQRGLVDALTHNGSRRIMAQRYIPEISQGDKRIIAIGGEAIPYALARIPAEHDFRGNLAQGAQFRGQPLSEQDHHIVNTLSATLRQQGLHFVGLDVIGPYLTEINVTSPTGICQLNQCFDLDIGQQFFQYIESLR